MWAFGVVLWELFSYGKIPYATLNNQETMAAVVKGHRMDPPGISFAAVAVAVDIVTAAVLLVVANMYVGR